jgi:hypothetical protein
VPPHLTAAPAAAIPGAQIRAASSPLIRSETRVHDAGEETHPCPGSLSPWTISSALRTPRRD